MAKQSVNLGLMLAKSQSSFGAEIAGLTSVDTIETIGAAKAKIDNGMTPIELVSGSFDQDASIPGITTVELSWSLYARSAGSDNPGQFGKCCKWSGMVEAEAVDGTYTYNFTSAQASWTDFSAWLYSGNLDTSGSILRKCYNGIVSPKWIFSAGKPTVMECTAKLAYSGIPAAATNPGGVKERTLPEAFQKASTLTLNGDSDYRILSGEIDPQQEVTLTTDPVSTYGAGLSVITNRKIKGTFKVYKELPSTLDPETALMGKTISTFAIEYGTVPQKIKFSSSYAQIVSIDPDDENGVETWTLGVLFERNDFTITVTTK